MRNRFCIYHAPAPTFRMADDSNEGEVHIVPLQSQLPAKHVGYRGHRSRAGIQYAATAGVRRYLPVESGPKVEGFPLRFKTSDGTEYVQRNGIRYRLDRLKAVAA